MGTISIRDATGTPQTAALVASTGSADDTLSLPVTQSTQDKAQAAAQSASLATLAAAATGAFANSTASTNATSVKVSAGTLWGFSVNNLNVAARYLKLYNKASAPTVGVDVPVMTVLLPAAGFVQWNGGAKGLPFSVGIAFALTANGADTDATAVGAGDHKVALAYT